MSNEAGSVTTEAMTRAFKALVTHVVIGVIVIGAILFVCQGRVAVNPRLLADYPDAAPEVVLQFLYDARYRLILWACQALSISWLTASWFLYHAQAARARDPETEGASRTPAWAALLFVTIIACSLAGWWLVWWPDYSANLAPDRLLVSIAFVGIGTILAFWLATGLAVARVMRRSVPGSGVLPDLWS